MLKPHRNLNLKLRSLAIVLLLGVGVHSFSWARSKVDPNETPPKLSLLIIGDSLSDGYGVKRDQAYPQLLENELQAQDVSIEVVNAAESGSISASAHPTLEFYLKRSKPDLLLIAIGGNDARAQKPASTIKANIEKTIKLAKQNNIVVILAGMKIFSNLGKEYGAQFEGLYKELAQKHKLQFIPFLLEGVAGHKELNISDGFHPNPEGHKKIAAHVLPFVMESAKKLSPSPAPNSQTGKPNSQPKGPNL